jgi:hypothetical protein
VRGKNPTSRLPHLPLFSYSGPTVHLCVPAPVLGPPAKQIKTEKGFFRLGSMVQVIEWLPSKCKALSSNPSTTKKKKKRRRKEKGFFRAKGQESQ